MLHQNIVQNELLFLPSPGCYWQCGRKQHRFARSLLIPSLTLKYIKVSSKDHISWWSSFQYQVTRVDSGITPIQTTAVHNGARQKNVGNAIFLFPSSLSYITISVHPPTGDAALYLNEFRLFLDERRDNREIWRKVAAVSIIIF